MISRHIACRVMSGALGAFFIAGACYKFSAGAKEYWFAVRTFRPFGDWPGWLIGLVAGGLVAYEIVLGVRLVIGSRIRACAIQALILVSIVSAAVALRLVDVEKGCGCTWTILGGAQTGRAVLVRNLALAVTCVVVACLDRREAEIRACSTTHRSGEP